MEKKDKGVILTALTAVTDVNSVIGDISGIRVSGIQYDSRRVKAGDLFCCVSGTFQDGHKYAKSAVSLGARALICEHELEGLSVPQIIVPNTRIAMAQIAAEYYGHPAESMTILGVTGTNGKTTTTYMLQEILSAAGKKTGVIGTIKNMIGNQVVPSEHTTPESVELQELLARMRDAGVEVVIMEVSSHSLAQDRVYGIVFDVAEFTNLTEDHLDYHGNFDNYFAAKKKLFHSCVKAVINVDDKYADRMIEGIGCPVTTFGISRNADVYAKDIEVHSTSVDFVLHKGREAINIEVPIPGLFSVRNAMGAAAVALECDIAPEFISYGLLHMSPVAGRLETLNTYGRDFYVILDYAHTPDALQNVLETIAGFVRGRVITLFGCGGDRDKDKRPIMGEVVGRLSGYAIVTSDNPRTEDPMKIIESVVMGVEKSGCEYTVIENRLEAIKYALSIARKDDIVLLAGKGHEQYQDIGGVKNHFDEKEIVDTLLKR